MARSSANPVIAPIRKPDRPVTATAVASPSGTVESEGLEEQILQCAIDALPQAVAVISPCGEIRAVNECWRELATQSGWNAPDGGIGESHLSESRIAVALCAESAVKAIRGIQAVVDGEEEHFEMEYRRDRGSEPRWYRMCVHPLHWPGPPRIILSYEDVTSTLRFEVLLERERNFTEAIFQTVRLSLMVLDTELSVVTVNAAFCDQFETTQDAVMNHRLSEMDGGAWNSSELRNWLGRLIRNSESLSSFEIAHDFPRIGPRTLILNARRMICDGHRSSGLILLTIEDVTDRRIAEIEIRALNTALCLKNQDLEAFSYTASHELQSPLVSILGFANHLREDLDVGRTDRARTFAEHIVNASDQMRQTINSLLELSRLGYKMLSPKQVDLNRLVEDVVGEILEGQSMEAITILTQPNLPMIYADPKRLHVVLMNLLTNAIKYGCGGTQDTNRIDIGGHATPVSTHLYIRDYGQGIERRHLAAIFDVFQRLSDRKNGAGVGLTIVKRIIDLHDGHVWVQSSPGNGCTMWMTFPNHQQATAKAASAASKPGQSQETGTGRD